MNPINFQQFELDSPLSDCESGVTGSSSSSSSSDRLRRSIFSNNLVSELSQTERTYELIHRRFLAGVGDKPVTITAIHRRNLEKPNPNSTSLNSISQARVSSFQLHTKALENKYNTNNNNSGPPLVKFGWYGTDKDNIINILSNGFSYRDLQTNINSAICLSPDDSPTPSVEDSGMDEDGLRHVLLCRVLIGRSELIHSESGQSCPSSDLFDSGVDSFDNPKKYFIWSSNMNTHILPEYVVTFKIKSIVNQSSPKGFGSKIKNTVKIPTSPWVSFPALISELGRFLGPDCISLIAKYHDDYKVRNITRGELIHKVRQIAGDKLLITVIKSFKGNHNNKDSKTSFGLSHHTRY